jgi:hypothetical protein
MSVEYRLVNKKNRTMYELGKGGWYDVMTQCGVLHDRDLLRLAIEEALYEPEPGYVAEIAAELFEFTKDTPEDQLVVFNDCGDETGICRSIGYRFTGSRYRPFDMDFLNRHLDGSESSKRRYNIDSWRDHPDFARFA